PAAAIPLPRRRLTGHHRPHGGGGAVRQAADVRTAGVDRLAAGAHLFSDRLPQPPGGDAGLGLGLLDAPAPGPHRQRHGAAARRMSPCKTARFPGPSMLLQELRAARPTSPLVPEVRTWMCELL